MAGLKIYGIEHSAATLRVLVTLAEKNVDDYSMVLVDFKKEEQKNPVYMKTLQVRWLSLSSWCGVQLTLQLLEVYFVGFISDVSEVMRSQLKLVTT